MNSKQILISAFWISDFAISFVIERWFQEAGAIFGENILEDHLRSPSEDSGVGLQAHDRQTRWDLIPQVSKITNSLFGI